MLFALFVFDITKNRKIKRNYFANKCKIKRIRLKKCKKNSKFITTLNAIARRLRNLFSFRKMLMLNFDNDFCNYENYKHENRKRNYLSLNFILRIYIHNY